MPNTDREYVQVPSRLILQINRKKGGKGKNLFYLRRLLGSHLKKVIMTTKTENDNRLSF